MQILIVFAAAFVIISIAAFVFGYKHGRKAMETAFVNNTMYVTVKELEDLAAVMRFNGASDDEIMVMVKPEWWEDDPE